MRNYEIYQARWQSTGDTTRAKTDDFAHQIHYNESEFGLRIILYQRLVTVTEKEQVMVLRTAPHYLTFAVLPLGLCSIEHGLCI